MASVHVTSQNGVPTAATAEGYTNNEAAAAYAVKHPPPPDGDHAATQAWLFEVASAGNVSPPTVTSPATVGGVPVPQQTAVSNPSVAVATPASANATPATTPPTDGGTDTGSTFNLGGSSKSEQKIAAGSNTSQKTAYVFPTDGIVVPPSAGTALNLFLADWYRGGRPSDDATNPEPIVQPKSLDPFEYSERGASIRVFGIGKDGTDQELIPAYTKFILEGVQQSHMERSQIVETFGDFYVFFFGERPPVYQFTGTLINTRNVNWVADFQFYYDNFLRGTKCVENKARLLVTYGGRQIEGFMLSTNNSTDASVEAGVKVSFPVVITKRTFLGFSDDFGFLTNASGTTDTKSDTFIALLDKIAGAAGTGTSNPAVSQAQNVMKDVMDGGPAAGMIA